VVFVKSAERYFPNQGWYWGIMLYIARAGIQSGEPFHPNWKIDSTDIGYFNWATKLQVEPYSLFIHADTAYLAVSRIDNYGRLYCLRYHPSPNHKFVLMKKWEDGYYCHLFCFSTY
jgi:hypothetical protein